MATFTPPKVYTFPQLEQLWIAEGGPRIEAPMAAAIALAESGGHADAENHNSNGTVDRGPWQINSVHGALSTTNPVANARGAVQIFKESGWGPWVTYKTGAYKQFLTTKTLRTGIKEGIEPSAPEPNPLQQVGEAVTGSGQLAEEGGKAVGNLINDAVGFSWGALSKFATTAVLLLAGAVLVVYGIMVAVRPRESAFSLPMPAIA